MKQNMKKALLVLCMAVCFLALAACGSAGGESEPVTESVQKTMKSGAEDYLKQFASYDDDTLASELKRVQKQKNTVMEAALTSWQSSKSDLGNLNSINSDSAFVERVDEESYKVTIEASFEKRMLVFTLTAEEQLIDSGFGTTTALVPTELLFSPVYTTSEKLTKAGLNTLMGMGTVFAVLIFISLIIASLKNVNRLEASMKAKKEAKASNAAAESAKPAPAPAAPVITAPAPAAPAPVPAVSETPAEVLPAEEENLNDDLELVAVITAAISAATSVPAEGLVVRSIRRRSGSKWKNA